MWAIMDLFSNVGQWPVMRNKDLSRGAGKVIPQATLEGNRQPVHIYDDDVISFVSVQFFDSTLSAVYFSHRGCTTMQVTQLRVWIQIHSRITYLLLLRSSDPW